MTFIYFLLIFMLFICIYFWLKNKVTYCNHLIIIDAIARHIRACEECEVEPLVYFYDMEEYKTTLYRWWDWGYTRILDPVQYEIIKPFIKERSKENAAQ